MIGIFITPLIQSCSDEGKHKEYQFTGMSAENMQFQDSVLNEYSGNPISHDDYALRLNFDHILTFDSDFTVYDYGPICTNSIQNIEIRTLFYYGPEFPANSIISSQFVYFPYPSSEGEELDNIKFSNYYKVDYAEDPIPSELDIFLLSPPSQSSNQRFIIRVNLSDGDNFTDTSSVVSFQI